MKSLKDYALNLTEQEYHEYPAWSYSLIARYAREGFGILPIIHNPIAPNPAMEFGSLFDAMITRPSDIIKEYAVSDVVAPNAEKEVFDILLRNGAKIPFAELKDEDIREAIEEAGYQKRWSYEAQYKHIAEFSDYYDIRRTGRKVVSTQDYNDAMQMKANYYDNPAISHLLTSGDGYFCQLQFKKELTIPFYNEDGTFSPKQVDVKAMFDMLVVSHKNKTIQPIDLKTSSMPAWDFSNSFVKMRYDIQAELYTDILSASIAGTEYEDYTILPFIFTCISRVDKTPVTYAYDPSTCLSFKEYSYKGWKELLAEIINYEDKQATVPSYISLDKPNDIRAILNRDKWQKDIS